MKGHMSNRRAAEQTVAAWRDAGQVDAEHESLIEAFLCLASEVDAGEARADVWREYRQTYQLLREVLSVGGDDDTASFLVSVSTPRRLPAEVRDS